MKISRLHNMEHFQFAGHVIAMCEESAIEKIKAVLEPLKTAVAEEDKALNLPRKQEGTADLEELDRVRDQAYRALQLLIEMHSCSDDATKRKSAQQMSDVLGRYPKLATANYDKETGMIKNLVTDLNAAELSVAVAQLGASGSITRLSAANSDFELRYRSLLKSAQPSGVFDVKALCVPRPTKPSTPSSAAWTRSTTLSQRRPNCPNSSSNITPWLTDIA